MSEKIKTAVMEVIKAHMDGEDKNTKAVLSDVMESVNELETLEQESTYYPPCQDCNKKMDEVRRIYDKIKEQEPCDDAISRDAVIELIERGVGNKSVTIDGFTFGKSLMLYHVKQLPSVTQKSETVTEFADRCRECGAKYGKLLKQKNGHWIETEYHRWRCSVCREKGMSEWDNIHNVRTNFCPNCGAKMVEPQESEA